MSDAFIGAWLVGEHVFNPDGTFAGMVAQRRRLQRLASGQIKVIQDCAPDPSLADHPMGRFAGHHEFTLSAEGPFRRYHGPAVIGSAVALGPRAMAGRGLWPSFGHNFTSYGLVPHPSLQLTGGKFMVATQMVANIVGVAVPDEGQTTWPTFDGPTWPGDRARRWVGEVMLISPTAEVTGQHAASRSYRATGFRETVDNRIESIDLEPVRDGYRVSGTFNDIEQLGIAKRFGPMLEFERCRDARTIVESTEVFDAQRGHLVTITKVWSDHTVHHYEVGCLTPLSED